MHIELTIEEKQEAELAESQRKVRNELIAETDTWGLSDYPVTTEQTAYRQALRDVPDQDGFPNTITWPTKP